MTTPLELLHARLRRFGRMRVRSEDAADESLSELLRPDAVASKRSKKRRAKKPAGGRDDVRILARQQPTEDLLRLRLERPAGFAFIPGQHLKLGLGDRTRKYTICSAPHQPWIELFIERQPGGTFTPQLFALREGDGVRIAKGASGSFTLASGAREHVMVATVTGVAPFVSMVRAAAHAGASDRFHVLQGASYADELGYADELEEAANVEYLPTVSRPDEARNAGWGGATGRVGAHLEPYLEQRGLRPERVVIYACGNPGMIDDVRRRLRPRGYRVRAESYD